MKKTVEARYVLHGSEFSRFLENYLSLPCSHVTTLKIIPITPDQEGLREVVLSAPVGPYAEILARSLNGGALFHWWNDRRTDNKRVASNHATLEI